GRLTLIPQGNKPMALQTYREFAPTGFDRAGAFLPDQGAWLVAPVSVNRDSDLVTKSNWEVQGIALDDAAGDYEIHRFGHWACGWFEIAIVRPGSECARVAEEIADQLADYPVLSESDLS